METPTLQGIIRIAQESFATELHTTMIGRVESYDASKQVADVQPVVQRHIGEDENGVPVYEQLPVIPNVMVQPIRAGGYHLHVPVKKGDHVLLSFCKESFDEWRENGGIVQPVDLRKHTAGYPVAIPGVATTNDPISNADATHLTIGSDAGDDLITFKGATIDVGKGASDFAALASVVDANFTAVVARLDLMAATYNAFIAAISVHTHAAIGPPLTAAAYPGETAALLLMVNTPPTMTPPPDPTPCTMVKIL